MQHAIGFSPDGLLRVHGYADNQKEALDTCEKAAQGYITKFPELGPISEWKFRLVSTDDQGQD